VLHQRRIPLRKKSILTGKAFANDETSQFLNAALVNNPMLKQPANGAGVTLRWDAGRDLGFSLGGQTSHDFVEDLLSQPFVIGEIDYHATFLIEGNYRLWACVSSLETNHKRQMYGGGISIDQLLTPQFGLFVRAGLNQIKGISRTFFAASGGLRWAGPLWNRPRGRVGVGDSFQRETGFFSPHGFSVLPDGSKVYVSSLGAHEVAVLDGATGRMIKRLAIGDVGRVAARHPQRYLAEIKGIVNPTLTKDGAFAYAANSDAGVVAIIDTKNDKIVKTLKVGEQPWRAYNSPDGRWMLIPNNGDSTVSVIDTTSHKIVAQLNAGSEMTGVNYALGGSKAYVISRGDSMVYVFDMQTFGMVARLKIGTNLALETAATTADGSKIYLASSSNDSVYVIDARTDQVKQITDVGRYPWGVSILAAGSPNYCD
jgi:YVTN family beta-propeller protein